MPLNSNALISLDDAKDFLSITDSSSDAILESIINQVSTQFETYCKREFHAADITEYHDGNGGDTLLLNQWPINSVASIYDDPDWEWTADTLIDSDEYRIVDDIYIQLKSSTFNDDPQCIKVTYNGGFSDIPEDLKMACIEQVAMIFQKHQSNLVGVRSRALADGSISYYVQALLPSVKQVLDSYRAIGY